MSNSEESAKNWRSLFPFDPYDQQVAGINAVLDTVSDGGIHCLEGPCGTGKTLIALVAAAHLVRDPETDFDRVVVATSKKQQIRAFEDDLNAISANALDPEQSISALTLVGKADLCPYVQTGQIDRANIYPRCQELRANTTDLVNEVAEQPNTSRTEAGTMVAEHYRASDSNDQITTQEATGPYRSSLPGEDGQEDVCPFYAGYVKHRRSEGSVLRTNKIRTPEDIRREGVNAGVCPHAEIRQALPHVAFIIGNYKHVFDPNTVEGLTGPLLDDSTLLICDEAHELVDEVRSELTHDVPLISIYSAAGDIQEVRNWYTGDSGKPEEQGAASEILSQTDIRPPDIQQAATFVGDVYRFLASGVTGVLADRLDANSWKQAVVNRSPDQLEQIEVEIQDPQNPDIQDELTRWAENTDRLEDWENAIRVGYYVEAVRQEAARNLPDGDTTDQAAIGDVVELLQRWKSGDHTDFYRDITLNPIYSQFDQPPDPGPWRAGYRATVSVANTIPQDEIAGTLDAFGGAILMSATLEPVDVFKNISGVTALDNGYQPPTSLCRLAADRCRLSFDEEEADEEDDDPISPSDASPDERARPVGTTTFDLAFPAENRQSLAVTAPKFTYANRNGDKGDTVRGTYRNVISDVVETTPGNVLVFMPSYRLASWIGEKLRNSRSVSKQVYIDESSSDDETEQLKNQFISGPPAVLTTSLRATLTEGVDFPGDQLRASVVCGLPIMNLDSNRATAVEEAYRDRFDELGFKYAFSVPALHKARQAIGRVIRRPEDIGVRVLVDERYTTPGLEGVHSFMPDYAQEEFEETDPDRVRSKLRQFWSQKER